MNFASLLRMHQNRQPINYHANQYMINCNRKNDTPIVYNGPNNYSGIKKRNIEPIEPMNQSLMEIYSNFEENPHVQWILQLQSHKVKIHKFKPSKIKTKKEEPQHTQKFQYRLHSQQRQPIHPMTQILTQENALDFMHQDHTVRQVKNYSPMHQMRPKKLNNEDKNWMQNLNQNKFSFGDDSQQISQVMQQKLHRGQQNKYQQQQMMMMQNESQLMNEQNKSYIEQRQQYEVQQTGYKGRGLNLMKEFEQFQDQNQQIEDKFNRNGKDEDKNQINMVHKILKEQDKNQQQQTDVTPNGQGGEFNPNVGFSFDQIDKIGQDNQNNTNNQQQTINNNKLTPKPQYDFTKQNQPTDKPQILSLNMQQNQHNTINKPKQTPTQQTKQPPITLINTVRDNQSPEKKKQVIDQNPTSKIKQIKQPQPNNDSNLRSRQSSPHRFYYKANVRTLTPEKFKYPRVESKIQSNTDIQPFTMESQATKTKTENNIKIVDAKIENVQSEKLIIVPSSDRLLALIDESKRLLESRNLNQGVKNQDKIRRIVLHQPPTETKIILKDAQQTTHKENDLLTKKDDTNNNNLQKVNDQQMQQKLTLNKIDTAQKNEVVFKQQTKKTPQVVTPQKNIIQPNIPSVSSPKSPLQQKPKFFNQLANVQTNYTVEKKNLSPYTRYTDNTAAQKQTSQFVTTANYQTNVVKNNEVGQQNYQQTNYTYKPLNLPSQQKQVQQKDTSFYKPPAYQPSLSPYQPTKQLYQPTVQPYSQFNDLSNNQKPSIQPQMNQNPSVPQVKTYSPYFPITNTNTVKPSSVVPVQQNKSTNQVYQTYTYNGFPSSQQQQQNQVIRPLSTNQTNNYIKINTNYVSPLEKYEKTEQKDIYQIKVNAGDVAGKENLRPIGLGIQGIKCVQSKIYEPKTLTTVQSDPKQTSIEFSLRIEQHFHIGTK